MAWGLRNGGSTERKLAFTWFVATCTVEKANIWTAWLQSLCIQPSGLVFPLQLRLRSFPGLQSLCIQPSGLVFPLQLRLRSFPGLQSLCIQPSWLVFPLQLRLRSFPGLQSLCIQPSWLVFPLQLRLWSFPGLCLSCRICWSQWTNRCHSIRALFRVAGWSIVITCLINFLNGHHGAFHFRNFIMYICSECMELVVTVLKLMNDGVMFNEHERH